MPNALILSMQDLSAWEARSNASTPGGALPYGMAHLRDRFALTWSDAPHRGVWRTRPLRLAGGATRRLAPGLQGSAAAVTSRRTARAADVVLSVFENTGLAYARLSGVDPRGSSAPHVMLTCWLAEDCGTLRPSQLRSIRRSVRSGTLLAVFSANQADLLVRHCGASRGNIRVVPFGVDTQYYDARHLDGPGGGAGIVAVGSDSRRDYGTLFAAARQADLPMTVVCRPENIAGLDVPAQVTVRHGVFDEDYRRLLHDADLVVTPTVAPAYPSGQSVVLEAMSMGRATLTTDSAAMRDYVDDGKTGDLMPAFDATATARALVELVADGERRSTLGAAAARAVRERFTFERMWSGVAGVMDEAITARVKPQ